MLKLGQNYDLLCNMIIRPPRFIYEVSDLGPRHFAIYGKPAQRTDFELVNPRGMILQCSHFEPLTNWGDPIPCVIYLHGNGGCRIESLDAVRTLLPCNISVFALDFAGSGLSDGEYVSLGAWERYDVATVVHYLRETKRCSTIGLWGRSMGAVTAILYSMEDPSVASMLLDSPFCSLQKIAEDLVLNIETLQKVPRLTRFAVSIALKAMRSTIKKRAKFDIKSLEILEIINKCYIPALFVHSKGDGFVTPLHSELLFARYSGDKNRVLVDGDHNSMRPNFFMDSASIFFMNTLRPDQASEINLSMEDPGMPPASHELATQAPPLTSASGEVGLDEIGVFVGNDGQDGSMVIDDMLIGNCVVIDGKEVYLDYFAPEHPVTSPPLSSPPHSSSSSASASTASDDDEDDGEHHAAVDFGAAMSPSSENPTSPPFSPANPPRETFSPTTFSSIPYRETTTTIPNSLPETTTTNQENSLPSTYTTTHESLPTSTTSYHENSSSEYSLPTNEIPPTSHENIQNSTSTETIPVPNATNSSAHDHAIQSNIPPHIQHTADTKTEIIHTESPAPPPEHAAPKENGTEVTETANHIPENNASHNETHYPHKFSAAPEEPTENNTETPSSPETELSPPQTPPPPNGLVILSEPPEPPTSITDNATTPEPIPAL